MSAERDEFFRIIELALDDADISRDELLREYYPLRDRDFRSDGFVASLQLAFEYEGLFVDNRPRKSKAGRTYFAKSRHLTIGGYSDDCEKYSWISGVLGIRIVRITAKMISDGRAGPIIREAILCAKDPRRAIEFRRYPSELDYVPNK